jgi:hypothetical protein
LDEEIRGSEVLFRESSKIGDPATVTEELVAEAGRERFGKREAQNQFRTIDLFRFRSVNLI